MVGRDCVVVAIAQGTRTRKVSATTHLKLLGTDSIRGKRRATVIFQHRLEDLGTGSARHQALRASGVNSNQMVRTAAVPAVMYGCEMIGLPNAMLHDTQCQVVAAAAAAPSAGDKSPDMVRRVIHGENGTLDSAFDAHVVPIKHWPLAY